MDMRDAVFGEIITSARKDTNVVLIVADADAFGIRQFKEEFSSRFFNVGVAEQNMINVACGLALSGKKVFICALAPFATYRCFEQIKANMCSMRLPVFIIGLGIGLSFGFDGPTHHTTCDIGVMSNVPELSIYNPSDDISAANCVRSAYARGLPSYIRVDKGDKGSFYNNKTDFTNGFCVLSESEKFCEDDVIISTGICTQYAMSYKHGLKIIDMFRIKPIEKNALLRELEGFKRIITYEEHVSNTGLGSIIANLIAEEGLGISLKKIALPEEQCFINGNREYLHKRYKIDPRYVGKAWTGYSI